LQLTYMTSFALTAEFRLAAESAAH
jgi:hypothetical protein